MTQIDDLATLRSYLTGMMEGRPGDDHPRIQHAPAVRGTVLAIVGGLAWRADPGSIRCRDRVGRMANVVWAAVNGHEYCFAYHHDGRVEIRDRNERGPALFTITDQTPVAEIWEIFAGLGQQVQAVA